MNRQTDEQVRAMAELLDIAPNSITIHDYEGRFLYANHKTLTFHGYEDREEFMALSVDQLDTPESRALIAERMRLIDEAGEASFEVSHFRKNGSVFPMRVYAKKTRWLGRPAIMSIATDITEKKQAEYKYQMLFQKMLSGFALHEIILDEQGKPADYRFLEVNPAFEKMTGLKAENIIGKTVLDVLPGVEPFWIERLGHVALTGTPLWLENYTAEIGKHFQVSAFSPVPNQFACIVRDITDNKKLENQVRQAEKMESIGCLAGGIAHDFNNMLSVILGHVQVLLEDVGPYDKTMRHALEAIEQAAQHSADLTSQLLGFARKQIASPKIIDLNASMENMMRMLRRIVEENIRLTWRPGVDIWPVRIDLSQLDQILVNLISNARNAVSNKGEIIITTANVSLDESYMDAHPGFVPGEYVLLAVSDNGCGMDRDMQKRIFDPFFTTRDVGQGTGMGLATVYGIVKQNKGFIYVDSEPGQGAIFTVYFPRQAMSEVFGKETAATKPVSNPLATILLIEDAPSVLEMCQLMLKSLGYHVLQAKTADEAVRHAETYQEKIHLMLCDVIMPDMNGAELAQRLVQIRPGIKCLYMSGYTADIIASQGILEESTNFIEKPFTKKALQVKIHDVLNNP